MLDISKRFFLSPSCMSDKKTTDHVLGILLEHKVPKSAVFKEIDSSLINSGDYLIRCFGSRLQVWQIEVIPFGITTRLLENLESRTKKL
jgi:hypothetical protein